LANQLADLECGPQPKQPAGAFCFTFILFFNSFTVHLALYSRKIVKSNDDAKKTVFFMLNYGLRLDKTFLLSVEIGFFGKLHFLCQTEPV